jgi:regulatory protein
VAGKITKIELQKKNKHRYSIFIDDEYAFGVEADVLIHHNLASDKYLSDNEIDEILADDEQKRAKEQAFRYLSNRDHSEKELKQKLKRKGFSDQAIDKVIPDLKNLQFLNDKKFAELFARNRILQKPIGQRQLEFDLKQKGIQNSIIEETLVKIYSEFNEAELARRLAVKRIQQLRGKTPIQIKRKTADFLLRRGFEWEIVREIIEELVVDQEI